MFNNNFRCPIVERRKREIRRMRKLTDSEIKKLKVFSDVMDECEDNAGFLRQLFINYSWRRKFALSSVEVFLTHTEKEIKDALGENGE